MTSSVRFHMECGCGWKIWTNDFDEMIQASSKHDAHCNEQRVDRTDDRPSNVAAFRTTAREARGDGGR